MDDNILKENILRVVDDNGWIVAPVRTQHRNIPDLAPDTVFRQIGIHRYLSVGEPDKDVFREKHILGPWSLFECPAVEKAATADTVRKSLADHEKQPVLHHHRTTLAVIVQNRPAALETGNPRLGEHRPRVIQTQIADCHIFAIPDEKRNPLPAHFLITPLRIIHKVGFPYYRMDYPMRRALMMVGNVKGISPFRKDGHCGNRQHKNTG